STACRSSRSPIPPVRAAGRTSRRTGRAWTWLYPSCRRSSRVYIEKVSAVPYRATFVRLLGFLRPYRIGLAVSVVLAVGSQAAQIAIIWVTKHVIDQAIRPRDAHDLWIFVWAIVGLGAAKALLMTGRRLISGKQALAVEMDL